MKFDHMPISALISSALAASLAVAITLVRGDDRIRRAVTHATHVLPPDHPEVALHAPEAAPGVADNVVWGSVLRVSIPDHEHGVVDLGGAGLADRLPRCRVVRVVNSVFIEPEVTSNLMMARKNMASW